MKSQKKKIGETKRKNTTSRTLPRRIKASDRLTSYSGGEAGPVKGRDFNAVENSRQAVTLISSIAAYAGKSAASEAKALHMPKVYANTAKVIIETVDGKKAVVATANNIPGKKYYRKYTSGTIMHATDK
ncbi:MAG TPA: hypothetical protein VFX43_19225 [Chitinophagaceae bacterium]|nr:hypothetical protein [Chitinophagaceae bacterium]